jgi:hypothetical protein
MVRRFLLALALAAAPSAAWACQCEDPAGYTAKDIEERAKWIASRDFVIAEVERITPVTPNDERYRVIRPLAGTSPDIIRADRFLTRLANGEMIIGPVTSCDYSAPPGIKRVMAFSRGGSPAVATCGILATINAAEALRPAGMCTQSDLENPAILKRVLQLLSR